MSNLYDQDPGKRDRLIAINDTKQCTKCGEHKLIADYYWLKAQNTPMAPCKECWKESRRERWKQDDTMRKAQYAWNKRNRPKINAARRKKYHSDPEFRKKLLDYQSEYDKRPGVVERRNAKQRERYAKDAEYRERLKQSSKSYRADKKS